MKGVTLAIAALNEVVVVVKGGAWEGKQPN